MHSRTADLNEVARSHSQQEAHLLIQRHQYAQRSGQMYTPEMMRWPSSSAAACELRAQGAPPPQCASRQLQVAHQPFQSDPSLLCSQHQLCDAAAMLLLITSHAAIS
jgi:hypothetical protein